jgi:STE24 endopeptidase
VESARLGSAVLMLAGLALTPAGAWLAVLAETFTATWTSPLRPAVTLLIYVSLLVLMCELAALPAVIYLARRVETAYARAAPRLDDVMIAHGLSFVVALLAALAAAAVVRIAMAMAGPLWWAVAAALLAAGLAAALGAAPVLFVRLGDVQPLGRPPLARRLADLVRQAGVPVETIGAWRIAESAPTAALVAGVGRTRRVLVAAELVRDWNDDEIAVVVAHELAHHVHRDLWRTWGLNAATLAAGLWMANRVVEWTSSASWTSSVAELGSLPLVALVTAAVWAAATPARHALSRHQERRADVFALALTGNAEAFAAAIRRLAAKHLTEERPSRLVRWLFFTHPPIAERLAYAAAWQRQAAVPVPASRSPAGR